MAFEHYIQSGGKRLRCGYTTGTCAALAAAAATQLLLTKEPPKTMGLMTPKGIFVEVEISQSSLEGGKATCGVVKDAGDDVDATQGLLICAQVESSEAPGITIDGGLGVGRVTKPGLDQPVGAAAINHVPRQMIASAVEKVQKIFGDSRGLAVTIFVPEGEKIAQKTFNPYMGIVGGISILGTSGIVEPMSIQALIDTLELEIRQAAALGAKDLILTPGNYGKDFLAEHGLEGGKIPVVKYSNFLGEALDAAAANGFSRVLLVGHLGKLVKLAGGIMNTHSRYADCRGEIFCAHAAIAGASQKTCQALMDCATSDAALEILQREGLIQPVLESLLKHITLHLHRRVAGAYQVGGVLYSNQYGYLGETEEAKEILYIWTGKKEFFTA